MNVIKPKENKMQTAIMLFAIFMFILASILTGILVAATARYGFDIYALPGFSSVVILNIGMWITVWVIATQYA